MNDWIIETQEFQIWRRRDEASRLRKEHDGYAHELVEEWKKLHSSKVEIALVHKALSRAKEQEAEGFQSLKNFKNELLASSRLAYVTGYEDGRDAVDWIYPDIDVSRVIILDFDEEEGSDGNRESDEVAPTEEALIGETLIEEALTEEASTKGIPIEGSSYCRTFCCF
ncbi:putative oligopeptide transporter 5-like [Cocos nucifera]|nr:putative oligopeptide transporter 5-like [Cocos nucifera]